MLSALKTLRGYKGAAPPCQFFFFDGQKTRNFISSWSKTHTKFKTKQTKTKQNETKNKNKKQNKQNKTKHKNKTQKQNKYKQTNKQTKIEIDKALQAHLGHQERIRVDQHFHFYTTPYKKYK